MKNKTKNKNKLNKKHYIEAFKKMFPNLQENLDKLNISK